MAQQAPGHAVRSPSLLRRLGKALRRFWPLYLMMVPGLLYFVVYKYVPMWGAQIAFKDFAIRKGIHDSPWKEPLSYWFSYFFKSPASRQIIYNTLVLSFSKLLVCMLPPLIFALAVSECRFKAFSRVIQTVSYLPHFLSWVIVYGICVAMLSESNGIINVTLRKMGFNTIPFLTSNSY
ncbi:MAG TPA: sugar ABC transporter permease, partial [Clostridia bacterium]|nr:sugar ABC transporter permease [Clostridia bacterium]